MINPVSTYLQADDADLEQRWQRLQRWLATRFGRAPNMETILFLIGIQSRGRGFEPKLKKEVKQDLIMEGTYCAFETLGLYERIGMDEEGAWLWERRVQELPVLPVDEQEKLLRIAVLKYFEPMQDDADPSNE